MGFFRVTVFLQFLFLMTPFFVLSMFLSMTQGWDVKAKRRTAWKVGLAIACIGSVLMFFGDWIFKVFAITIDAFRIGGGALLFLSAVGLVNSNSTDKKPAMGSVSSDANIAVVPLAIPVTVGPGTIGAILVIGAEAKSLTDKLVCLFSMSGVFIVLTAMLLASAWVEQKLGKHVIVILSKLTGLVLSAMAAQMIFTGIRAFLK